MAVGGIDCSVSCISRHPTPPFSVAVWPPIVRQPMAHVIAQPCIGTKDTACVAVCPVDCIHPTKDEGTYEPAEQLYIDPDVCIDCGLCVDECPVNAIFPLEDLPKEWASFIEKNTAYFKK